MLTYFSATLAYVRARLGELHAREQEVTAVEYALMVAIIAVLSVGGFFTLFNVVQTPYGNVGDCLDSGPLPERLFAAVSRSPDASAGERRCGRGRVRAAPPPARPAPIRLIQFGTAFNTRIQATNAAREAARLAVIGIDDFDDVGGQPFWEVVRGPGRRRFNK